jgi:sugar-phosphatase
MGKGSADRLPSRVQALILDFDDTIVESERLNERLFFGILKNDHGIELSGAELDATYGLAWSGVFRWLRDNKGFDQGEQEVWAAFLAAKTAHLRSARLRSATGLDLFLALPARRAIVSGSTREELRMMMENIGLPADAVEFVLCDEDCAQGKPDPEGFLRALARLGVPASHAVVFEDSTAGLLAARAAGVTAAFVAELASRDCSADADIVFENLARAAEAVRGLLDPRRPPR